MLDDDERYDDDDDEVGGTSKPEAIFTCKFPGCTRTYASTDGVRKHCRKSHPDWLREVDLEKASTGCRWAAYCTRAPTAGEAEGESPSHGGAGQKRARDSMAPGGASAADGASSSRIGGEGGFKPKPSHLGGGGGGGGGSSSSSSQYEKQRERPAPLGLAMDGKSALRPPRPIPRSSVCENAMPPDMICIPNDPLLTGVGQPPALTPNAMARWRLGEIADSESSALLNGGGTWAPMPSSPLCDFANAPLPKEGGFFVQWAVPPLKRVNSKDLMPRPASDASLNTTVGASTNNAEVMSADSPNALTDDGSNQQDSPATFLESVLA